MWFAHVRDFSHTTSIKVWNKTKGVSARIAGYGSFGYTDKAGFRDWEQQLIERWNIDSIRVLEKPTFYLHETHPPFQYYVYQIVITNKRVKSRQMKYRYLYIPNEYENDPIRSKQTLDR